MLPLIAPILGTVVSISTGIVTDGVAKQLVPTDLKALPGFAVKLGVGLAGALLAAKISSYVVTNVNSVVETATKTGSEEIDPAPADD